MSEEEETKLDVLDLIAIAAQLGSVCVAIAIILLLVI